jgi:hypothetical protein
MMVVKFDRFLFNSFIMNKILTIAATGVLVTLTYATQTLADTATVTMSGTVPQVCNITSTTPGNLALNSSGDNLSSENAGGNHASVTVKCNKGTSLKLTGATTNAPAGANAYSTTYKFKGGSGNPLFVNATGDTITPVSTKRTGATANISSSVTALNDEYLTPGFYSVTVDVTLTP